MSWPAAPLLGSVLVVTVCSFAGVSMALPDWLKNIAFCVIGVSLGNGFTPTFLSDVMRWPISLAALIISIVLIMAATYWMLTKLYKITGDTALLSVAPGLLSYTLSIAAEGRGDAKTITILQGFRVLIITLILPVVIALIGEVPSQWSAQASIEFAYWQALSVLIGAYMMGMMLTKVSLPSAYLLSGLMLSGVLHVLGVVHGQFSPSIAFVGFAIAGTLVGTRFQNFKLQEIKRLGLIAMTTTLVALILSALVSALVASWLDVSFGQVWVAFAPGGVEAMASIALTMGYDPIYVATHHICRLFFLIFMITWLTRSSSSAQT